jgi:hypothetical protein
MLSNTNSVETAPSNLTSNQEEEKENVNEQNSRLLVPKQDDNNKSVIETEPTNDVIETEKKENKEQVIPEQQQQDFVAAVRRHLDEVKTAHKNEVEELKSQLGTLQFINELPQKLNLAHAEIVAGLELTSKFKTDPVGTVRYLLEEVAALGYDVGNLLCADSANIGLAGITKLINQKFKPYEEERAQVEARTQAQVAAQQQYDIFIAKHPHSEVHESIIAKMLQKNPNETPELAYYKLVAFAARNGLDFAQPLQTQIANMRQQHVAQTQQKQVPQQKTKPLPTTTKTPASLQKVPKPLNNWDEIISSAIRENM